MTLKPYQISKTLVSAASLALMLSGSAAVYAGSMIEDACREQWASETQINLCVAKATKTGIVPRTLAGKMSPKAAVSGAGVTPIPLMGEPFPLDFRPVYTRHGGRYTFDGYYQSEGAPDVFVVPSDHGWVFVNPRLGEPIPLVNGVDGPEFTHDNTRFRINLDGRPAVYRANYDGGDEDFDSDAGSVYSDGTAASWVAFPGAEEQDVDYGDHDEGSVQSDESWETFPPLEGHQGAAELREQEDLDAVIPEGSYADTGVPTEYSLDYDRSPPHFAPSIYPQADLNELAQMADHEPRIMTFWKSNPNYRRSGDGSRIPLAPSAALAAAASAPMPFGATESSPYAGPSVKLREDERTAHTYSPVSDDTVYRPLPNRLHGLHEQRQEEWVDLVPASPVSSRVSVYGNSLAPQGEEMSQPMDSSVPFGAQVVAVDASSGGVDWHQVALNRPGVSLGRFSPQRDEPEAAASAQIPFMNFSAAHLPSPPTLERQAAPVVRAYIADGAGAWTPDISIPQNDNPQIRVRQRSGGGYQSDFIMTMHDSSENPLSYSDTQQPITFPAVGRMPMHIGDNNIRFVNQGGGRRGDWVRDSQGEQLALPLRQERPGFFSFRDANHNKVIINADGDFIKMISAAQLRNAQRVLEAEEEKEDEEEDQDA